MENDAVTTIEAGAAIGALIDGLGELERRLQAAEQKSACLEGLLAVQARGLELLGRASRSAHELSWAVIRLLHDLLERPQDEKLASELQRGLAEVKELERLFAADQPDQKTS